MKQKINILIIEDEEAIRTGLADVLVYHGYTVDSAADGRQGLTMALSGKHDLILLDIMLPEVNGFEVCQKIRENDKEQPIIMLTAKTGDQDIIQGLSLGADDYVAKPFSVAQLVLRIQAVLRRSRVAMEMVNYINLGEMKIDCINLTGGRQGKETLFTRKEIEVLQYLNLHSDRPVSREELLNKIWGYSRELDIETRTVDIHIAKLRRKIESEPARPRYLVTVRGAGYKLQAD